MADVPEKKELLQGASGVTLEEKARALIARLNQGGLLADGMAVAEYEEAELYAQEFLTEWGQQVQRETQRADMEKARAAVCHFHALPSTDQHTWMCRAIRCAFPALNEGVDAPPLGKLARADEVGTHQRAGTPLRRLRPLPLPSLRDARLPADQSGQRSGLPVARAQVQTAAGACAMTPQERAARFDWAHTVAHIFGSALIFAGMLSLAIHRAMHAVTVATTAVEDGGAAFAETCGWGLAVFLVFNLIVCAALSLAEALEK